MFFLRATKYCVGGRKLRRRGGLLLLSKRLAKFGGCSSYQAASPVLAAVEADTRGVFRFVLAGQDAELGDGGEPPDAPNLAHRVRYAFGVGKGLVV